MTPDSRQALLRRSGLDAVEEALNLNRIYRLVKAYPIISGVPDLMTASRDDVLAGYGRIKSSGSLGSMCEQTEKDIRAEHARAIAALHEELVEAYRRGYAEGLKDA